MNINSEDEIFSILKPVETCLAEDDKARLWARIRQDCGLESGKTH